MAAFPITLAKSRLSTNGPIYVIAAKSAFEPYRAESRQSACHPIADIAPDRARKPIGAEQRLELGLGGLLDTLPSTELVTLSQLLVSELERLDPRRLAGTQFCVVGI